MAKSENQKIKILYILDYLQKNSHQDHPVRASELMEMLERHNILCDRKTIYSDISVLQDFGIDILRVTGRNGGYYIASRNFQLPELKQLIDAVQSSRFLTEKKSRELIEKLCAQCNEQDARLVRRDVYVSGRVKSMNETIYYNVDAIQEAIAQNRQIGFRYFDWGIDGKRVYRQKSYTASPYGLCQDNENCYLLALSPRHGITSYRVDRMSDITLTGEKRVPCPELTGKNLTDYANRMFGMFSGDTVAVKLRFHRDLSNVVIDRFGKDIIIAPVDEDHFRTTVTVAVSKQFFGWIMGIDGDVRRVAPDSVVKQIRAEIESLAERYK